MERWNDYQPKFTQQGLGDGHIELVGHHADTQAHHSPAGSKEGRGLARRTRRQPWHPEGGLSSWNCTLKPVGVMPVCAGIQGLQFKERENGHVIGHLKTINHRLEVESWPLMAEPNR